MSDKDDPFGLSSDAGRTRIRPIGGAGRPAAPAAGQTWGGAPTPAQPAFGSFGGPSLGAAPGPARPRGQRPHANPLVAAFAPLLELAPELERAHPPGQPEVLRQRVQGALIDARDAAVALGQPLTRANQGAWFVAALIDDIALNTPWGGHSDWPRQPIVTQLTGEVDAGSRFFRHLEELMAHANRDPDLLELAYLCLDLGQSTGGFTDALLQAGAASVVGIDVGHSQLNPKLQADERVTSFEGINARDVTGSPFAASYAPHSFDFVTADLSFITSTHVLPTMVEYLAPGGHLLVLIKPQFELQPAQIGKGGIVKDKVHFIEVENRLWQASKAQGLKVQKYFQSPIKGGNGNTEFFIWARQPAA